MLSSKVNSMILAVLVIMTSSFVSEAKESYDAKVIEVLKGDVLVINTRKGDPSYFYILGVDAPELNQKGGRESRSFTEKALLGKTLYVNEIKRKNNKIYGSLGVGYGTRDFGSILIKNGHAWARESELNLVSAMNKSSYPILQDKARLDRVGLWRNNDTFSFGASRPSKFRELGRDKLDQSRFNGGDDPKYNSFGRDDESSQGGGPASKRDQTDLRGELTGRFRNSRPQEEAKEIPID